MTEAKLLGKAIGEKGKRPILVARRTMRPSGRGEKDSLGALDASTLSNGAPRTLDRGALVGTVLKANGAHHRVFGLNKLHI